MSTTASKCTKIVVDLDICQDEGGVDIASNLIWWDVQVALGIATAHCDWAISILARPFAEISEVAISGTATASACGGVEW
jgi:hypothetical protein